jgi:hypothetical protein
MQGGLLACFDSPLILFAQKATLWYRDAGMTLDQKIQIWVAVGTWVAGLATLAAVIVALRLAKQVEKVKLKVQVGLRELASSWQPGLDPLLRDSNFLKRRQYWDFCDL